MTMLTFTAYALDGFAYAVEAHSGRRTARVTVASCLMSGGRPAASREWWRWLLRRLCRAGQQIIALLTSLPSLQQLADRYLIWQIDPAGDWRLVLSAGRHVYRRDARGGDAQQHGGRGGGFRPDAADAAGARQPRLWLALVFLALRGLSLAVIWRRHWRRGTWFS
jgi:MATE family multidrug resistance protein